MVDRASPNARLLAGDETAEHTSKARIGGALGTSMCTHLAGFLLIALVMSRVPAGQSTATPLPGKTPDIVWIVSPGETKGGGAGGNRTPQPPRLAKLAGRDSLSVPVVKPLNIEAERPKDTPKVDQPIDIPAVPTAAAMIEQVGLVSALPTAPSESLGPGADGGAGNGRGGGNGPGGGTGLGSGSIRGTGGGIYRDGAGVVSPRLIREVKPAYTSDAMRAQVQGVVAMQAVVLPDGSVGRVQITRSLDSLFGLDQEALKTVKLWRFAPGTRAGEPVPVLVEIELAFTLR